MFSAVLEYQFLQNAIIAGILSSIVCGIIGVIVIEKKLVMMSGGIAHTSYAGIGLGYLLGFEPILGAFAFSLSAALGIGFLKRRGSANFNVVIALFWSFGMALGIFFIALAPGYPPDITSYLFGSILTVTQIDIYLMAALTVIVVLVITALFNNWKAYLFDEEFSSIMGIKTGFLEYLLLILIAMTVVVLIRVVGIILVLALLTAPAAISGMFVKSLKGRMALSVIAGIVLCIAGLALSYNYNIASGATIVILSVISYAVLFAVNIIIGARSKKRQAAK